MKPPRTAKNRQEPPRTAKKRQEAPRGAKFFSSLALLGALGGQNPLYDQRLATISLF
jgi:hypothetical protein